MTSIGTQIKERPSALPFWSVWHISMAYIRSKASQIMIFGWCIASEDTREDWSDVWWCLYFLDCYVSHSTASPHQIEIQSQLICDTTSTIYWKCSAWFREMGKWTLRLIYDRLSRLLWYSCGSLLSHSHLCNSKRSTHQNRSAPASQSVEQTRKIQPVFLEFPSPITAVNFNPIIRDLARWSLPIHA